MIPPPADRLIDLADRAPIVGLVLREALCRVARPHLRRGDVRDVDTIWVVTTSTGKDKLTVQAFGRLDL